MKSISIINLLLVSLFLLVAGATADTIQVQSVQVNAIGDTVPVNIILDSTPAGVAGYEITVSLSNPSVASITDVSFPAWAILNDSTSYPASSVQLRTVDLYEEVDSGAIDVPFGTITLQGDTVGSTDVVVTIKNITSDTGESISRDIVSGTFSVGASSTYPSPVIADHTKIVLSAVPQTAIEKAKTDLHIAYWHTSHGSQITDGMSGLTGFSSAPYGGSLYTYNSGGTNGALDLSQPSSTDLGNSGWATTVTRNYLNAHTNVNVVMWSWCGQVSSSSENDINNYLSQMNQLETDYPNVKFVYMTGHLDGSGDQGNLNLRNEQIRAYARANNKILFDFADIESYDPDGLVNYMELNANDFCDYDGGNWAENWQTANPGKWYNCNSAHSKPLNANMKAYAAWWLWARLAGWDGTPVTSQTHAAELVSNTLPATMSAGERKSVSITVKNVGTQSWTSATGFGLGATGNGDAHTFLGTQRVYLPTGTTVAPGESYTFTFTMTAPSTTGTYTPQFRMLQENVKWFGETISTSVQVTASTHAMQMVSNTLPATMSVGEVKSVSIMVKNTGTQSWTKATGFGLGTVGNSDAYTFLKTQRVYLPTGTTVAPGESYTFTFTMTAPLITGTYSPQFGMLQENVKWFGETISTSVQVN